MHEVVNALRDTRWRNKNIHQMDAEKPSCDLGAFENELYIRSKYKSRKRPSLQTFSDVLDLNCRIRVNSCKNQWQL